MIVANSPLPPGIFTVRSVGHIGAGGLGSVDEVEVIESNSVHPVGARLARKRLGDGWQNDAGAQARFEREIEMMGTMQHRHIVCLEGVSVGSERFYLMPRYAGSLRTALAAGRRFPTPAAVAACGAKIANALSYAHGLNFIHRDLKPENILLDEAGEPHVADWGLGQFVHLHSKVLDLTRGGPMGTAYYCSMEQWASGRCDVTGDVYSLGIILAELAAGRAFPIDPPGSGVRHDVVSGGDWGSRLLNATIRKMTSVLPSARHQSMGEVALTLGVIA